MSQDKKQLGLFGSTASTLRRQPAGGVSGPAKPYPRRPAPTITALVINPEARTVKRAYIRPTATGLKSVFPVQRATFQDFNDYRVYATAQNADKITNRTTLPGWELGASGLLLITGPKFSSLDDHTAEGLMKGAEFSCTDGTRTFGIFPKGTINNTPPTISLNET